MDLKFWIYIHIPRTGGTTLVSQIGRSSQWPRHTHIPLRAFDNSHAIVFTVVRNPYDRLVSLCSRLREPTQYKTPLPVKDFEDWVLRGFSPSKILNADIQYRFDATIPMSWFIDPEEADYIGRFEDWASVTARISDITGRVLKDPSYRAGSSTAHYPYPEYFRDADVLTRVQTIYRQDFSLFGYSP